MEELYCIGCGIKLQCDDETKEGFVHPNALNKEFILCKRCFQLKHYGKFVESKLVKNSIDLVLNSAAKDDMIVLIVDCVLNYTPLISILNKLKKFKNIIVVANRYDLYESYFKKNKIMEFLKSEFKKCQFNVNKIFIIDNNIENIFEYIEQYCVQHNCYLVGLENAGKTTFVNLLLKNIVHEQKNFLVQSKYPGTTIDLIKIPINNKSNLIDTPGIKSDGNILHYLEKDLISKLYLDKKIKQSMYQLNDKQTLLISNLIRFDFVFGNKQTIIFYGSEQLEILRCKTLNVLKTFKNHEKYLSLKNNLKVEFKKTTFENSENENKEIVIEGLGFIKVGTGIFDIYTLKNVHVYIRNSIL